METNKKAYSETLEEPVQKLSSWYEVMGDSKWRWNKPKTEKELDVPGLGVAEPVNDRFATAVDY